MSEDEQRAAIIAASGSGGSAQGFLPQMAGLMRFGSIAFGQEPGGPMPPLVDDHGNVLMAKDCGDAGHVGSHIWDDGGVRSYCAGPS